MDVNHTGYRKRMMRLAGHRKPYKHCGARYDNPTYVGVHKNAEWFAIRRNYTPNHHCRAASVLPFCRVSINAFMEDQRLLTKPYKNREGMPVITEMIEKLTPNYVVKNKVSEDVIIFCTEILREGQTRLSSKYYLNSLAKGPVHV
jgi:hypothetical protein